VLISELWGSGSQVDGSALIMTRGKGLYMYIYIYVNKVFVPYFNVFNDVSFSAYFCNKRYFANQVISNYFDEECNT
jgi:hypothetical protein